MCQPEQAEQSLCSGWPVKHLQVQKNIPQYQSTQYQGTPAPWTSQSKLVVCFEDLTLTKSGRKIREGNKRKYILSLSYSEDTHSSSVHTEHPNSSVMSPMAEALCFWPYSAFTYTEGKFILCIKAAICISFSPKPGCCWFGFFSGETPTYSSLSMAQIDFTSLCNLS